MRPEPEIHKLIQYARRNRNRQVAKMKAGIKISVAPEFWKERERELRRELLDNEQKNKPELDGPKFRH